MIFLNKKNLIIYTFFISVHKIQLTHSCIKIEFFNLVLLNLFKIYNFFNLIPNLNEIYFDFLKIFVLALFLLIYIYIY